MHTITTSLTIICLLLNWSDAGTLPASQQAEQALANTLLTGYTRTTRPAQLVNIEMTASILQIVSIDEKQQIMTSSLFITQCWTDDRLSWTPSATNYSSNFIMLPVRSIWIPDTMIINSADTSGYLTVNNDYSLASVDSDGDVCMILPALTVRTRCSFSLQKFPFDKQMCAINITSWSQSITKLWYSDNRTSTIDISSYSQHPLWKLRSTDMVVLFEEDRIPFESSYNSIISIQLYLERKALYFMLNGIFACLILNCVTLLSYTLPFGSQIGLCMTCFMTYSVYSLNFSNLFPQQSEYIMLITLYFLFSMCWTLISMVWFIICNHYISKGEMPENLYKFCGSLQKIFVCCFPPKKPEDDKKKDKDLPNESNKKTEDGPTVSQSTDKSQSPGTVSCFPSCFRRHNQIDSKVFEKTDVLKVEDADDNTTASKDETEKSTAVTSEESKVKCNFCNRCESCQTEFDKDKAKGKMKKEVEARCSALNYLVFLWLLLFMFIANMAIWLSMSQ